MNGEKLAINGGPRAITISSEEQWKRPVEEEKRLVNDLIEKGLLSGSGEGLPLDFEGDFRKYIGSNYCLTVDHGSSALASAFYAAGVGPGDEVITPTIGYIGSYCGALHMGARLVFCDVDPKTLLIDPEDAERRITRHTRAIDAIHLWGQVCDMDSLMAIGRRYGITIVEDAAHCTGAEWDGKKIGNAGDITCFSLQGTDPHGKPVSGGEGGIVTTNNREFYERQLIYCHLHRTDIEKELTNPEYRRLDAEVLGLKWRAHPLALAIAKVSLSSLEYRNRRRIENRSRVFKALKDLPGIEPIRDYEKAKPAGFYGGLKIKYNSEQLDGLSISKFVEAMNAEGAPISASHLTLEHLRSIFTRGFDLWGHDRGPLGSDFRVYKKGDFPVAEGLSDKVLTIPAYIEVKDGFLDQYIDAFRKVTSNYKSLLA